MRKMMTLVNREFWEQKGIFYNVPLILTVILTAIGLCSFFLALKGSMQPFEVHDFVESKSAVIVKSMYDLVSVPFIFILWLLIFYYFLGALYDDRKDKSILFWQSLPISQTETILSKLMAGLLLAPFCVWVITLLTHVLLLGIYDVFLILIREQSWTSLWNIPAILLTWLRAFPALLFQALWLLPLFTWCLLCSAYAKKAPALRAFVPIVLLIILDTMMFQDKYFFHYIVNAFRQAMHSWVVLTDTYAFHTSGIKQVPSLFQNQNQVLNFTVGLGLSFVFIILAGWFRNRCHDFE